MAASDNCWRTRPGEPLASDQLDHRRRCVPELWDELESFNVRRPYRPKVAVVERCDRVEVEAFRNGYKTCVDATEREIRILLGQFRYAPKIGFGEMLTDEFRIGD